ncbi:MAG: hypothetical protein KDA52_05440, partial [Planctomycetaceae bacterium]|nr:hypothetical protein [Planctomycetaceae bacterium]
TGFEPATSTSRTCGDRVASENIKGLAQPSPGRCTNGCTTNGDLMNGEASQADVELRLEADPIGLIDPQIATLPDSDRGRLAGLVSLWPTLSDAKRTVLELLASDAVSDEEAQAILNSVRRMA